MSLRAPNDSPRTLPIAFKMTPQIETLGVDSVVVEVDGNQPLTPATLHANDVAGASNPDRGRRSHRTENQGEVDRLVDRHSNAALEEYSRFTHVVRDADCHGQCDSKRDRISLGLAPVLESVRPIGSQRSVHEVAITPSKRWTSQAQHHPH